MAKLPLLLYIFITVKLFTRISCLFTKLINSPTGVSSSGTHSIVCAMLCRSGYNFFILRHLVWMTSKQDCMCILCVNLSFSKFYCYSQNAVHWVLL